MKKVNYPVEATVLPEKRERKPFERVYASNVAKSPSGPFYVQYWYDALGRVSVYFQEGEAAILEFEEEKNTFASCKLFYSEEEREEFVASL